MKPKSSMLAHCKHVLKSVRFNRKLFLKEYKKALRWLEQPEAQELKLWLRTEMLQSI
jgi:hypothetical protein